MSCAAEKFDFGFFRSLVGHNMKRFLASLIYMLGLSGLAHAAPLTEDQFTKVFAKALRSAQPAISATVKGRLELSVKDAEGKETTAFLDNAYTQYLRDPKAIDDIIKSYVASFAETQNKETTIDRSRIVPIIKDRKWLVEIQESVRLHGGKQALENVYEDFNEELVIIYAEDTPKNISYLSPKELEGLGIPRPQLRALAIANLRKLIPKPELHPGANASMFTAGGDYEASLLLFDDLWANLSKVDGEIVVAVPARDLLLFTGSHNQQGLAKLREFATKAARESAYRLTDTLFVYRNGRFLRFE